MSRTFIYLCVLLLSLVSCNQYKNSGQAALDMNANHIKFENGYSDVNGLKMYYEIYQSVQADTTTVPIVLVHGGGSTIQTSFEKVIQLLAKHRKVIAVELQAHGRTNDRNADLSFEQDADDVAALLKNLGIAKADFLGFSNGGTTTLQIAIRHPQLVGKMILGSALAKRNGVPIWFWEFMQQAKLENMPAQLQLAYKKVSPNSSGLQVMHDRDAKRMVNFKDIPNEQIEAIKVPTLLIIGDKDVITLEHAVEMHRQIANSSLAVIPGGHGSYIGEITTITPEFKESDLVVPLMEKFLGQKK